MLQHVFPYFRNQTFKKKVIMKKLFLALTAAVALVGFSSFVKGKADAVTFAVNTAKSRIDFVGSKKADFHTGSFNLKSGEIIATDGKLTGGKFVIDVAGLKVTDGAGDRLAGHLKSAEFFDVATYPEASFEITGVKYSNDANVEISGTLTIKDKKVPMVFPGIVRSVDDKRFFAQAFFTIDAKLLPITDKYSTADVPVQIYLFGTK